MKCCLFTGASEMAAVRVKVEVKEQTPASVFQAEEELEHQRRRAGARSLRLLGGDGPDRNTTANAQGEHSDQWTRQYGKWEDTGVLENVSPGANLHRLPNLGPIPSQQELSACFNRAFYFAFSANSLPASQNNLTNSPLHFYLVRGRLSVVSLPPFQDPNVSDCWDYSRSNYTADFTRF